MEIPAKGTINQSNDAGPIVGDYEAGWPEHFRFLYKRIAGGFGSMVVARHVGARPCPTSPPAHRRLLLRKLR